MRSSEPGKLVKPRAYGGEGVIYHGQGFDDCNVQWQKPREDLARYRLHVVNVGKVEKHPITVDGLLVPNEMEGGLREVWYQTAPAYLERIEK